MIHKLVNQHKYYRTSMIYPLQIIAIFILNITFSWCGLLVIVFNYFMNECPDKKNINNEFFILGLTDIIFNIVYTLVVIISYTSCKNNLYSEKSDKIIVARNVFISLNLVVSLWHIAITISIYIIKYYTQSVCINQQFLLVRTYYALTMIFFAIYSTIYAVLGCKKYINEILFSVSLYF